jgi:hypothetical protein
MRVYTRIARTVYPGTSFLMNAPDGSEGRGYNDLYKDFDSPFMQQLRLEAYEKDIGQHSWVTAEELERDIPRLKLSRSSRFLDLGCGPCGPLTFIISQVGCARQWHGLERGSNRSRTGSRRFAGA